MFFEKQPVPAQLPVQRTFPENRDLIRWYSVLSLRTFSYQKLMDRLIKLLLLVAVSGCFSSCFQFIEDVSLNEDGSGTVVLTANLSQSRTKLASIMLLDSVNGYKVPSQSDVRREMASIAERMAGMEGISRVSHDVNFDNYIAVLKFSFSDVSNLNEVMETVFREMKVSTAHKNAYRYDRQQRLFERVYTYVPQAKAEYDSLKPADRAVFKEATFTSIYRFERPVARQTNSSAKLSASKKAVMLQTPILDLIHDRHSLSNHIQLSH